MNDKLMLTPFKQALTALQYALNQPKNDMSRDATIQRFEYTFELAWKTIKRHLKQEVGVEEYSIKSLFREAARVQLIDHPENWFYYLQARNLTSHTYNEKTAEETYAAAKKFAPEAEKLLKHLESLYDPTAK